MQREQLSPKAQQGYLLAVKFVTMHNPLLHSPLLFNDVAYGLNINELNYFLDPNIRLKCVLSAVAEDFGKAAQNYATGTNIHTAREQQKDLKRETLKFLEICTSRKMFAATDNDLAVVHHNLQTHIGMGFLNDDVTSVLANLLPGAGQDIDAGGVMGKMKDETQKMAEHLQALDELIQSPEFHAAYCEILEQCRQRATRIEKV